MKRLIYAMSYDRRKILHTAYRYSGMIADHVIKCIVYKQSNVDYDHWIGETANWIAAINRMKPKKGFKLKAKDYKDNLFIGLGDELRDAELDLNRFKHLYVNHAVDPYPDFEITSKLCENLFNAYWELADVISKKLGKYDEEAAKADITLDIHKVLDKYC